MKRLLIFLISATLIINSAFAATALKKGQLAPSDGVFFSNEEAQKLMADAKELDTLKKLNLSLNLSLDYTTQNNEILQKKTSVLMDQNNTLATRLYEARDVSNMERIMWFGLGVLGTGLAAYGISKIK